MSLLSPPKEDAGALAPGVASAGIAGSINEGGVSIVVCTYTEARWDDLMACMESVRRQTLAPDDVIVVVDHNPRLLERVRELGIHAVANRYSRGLSGARNTGVEETRGELIAFLDDDAVASPTWLEKLVRPFDDDAVLGVGGMIEPLWTTRPASWFPEEFYWVLGCTYRGSPTALAPVRNPFGASMCLRRAIFQEVALFREGIGRANGAPMGCEETELCIRAHQRWTGSRFVFQPESRIHHRVPGSRLRWRYFLSRCYAEGISKALIARSVGPTAALSEERRYALRVLPIGVLRGMRDGLIGGHPSGILRAFAIVLGLAATGTGYLSGHRRHEAIPS